MAIKELNEEQLRACELVAKGENNTNIAKLIGKTRKTVIEWKKDDMFKAEVDRQVSLLKSRVDEKIAMNIEPLMDKLIQIALKDGGKTSLDAIIYSINRFVGTPTNKTQDISNSNDNHDNNEDIDIMIERLKKENDKAILN